MQEKCTLEITRYIGCSIYSVRNILNKLGAKRKKVISRQAREIEKGIMKTNDQQNPYKAYEMCPSSTGIAADSFDYEDIQY